VEPFKAFLSHRYDAGTVNEFFFQLFSDVAEVQFDVDAGKTSTNVTRLERMIRDADAFLGIYPITSSTDTSLPVATLRENSEYFRLELDLAARAQKPGLIFYDSRYKNVLSPPPSMIQESFDIKEILSTGSKPSATRFAQAFFAFSERVRMAKQFELSERRFRRVTEEVGIWVPSSGLSAIYDREHLEYLKHTVSANGSIPWSYPGLESLHPH
jgi:hypothetical protein